MNPKIYVDRLVKTFKKRKGDTNVVDGLSFSVNDGNIVGFIGPNGAGKTTTIKMLLDLIRPSSGKILFIGKPPHDKNIKRIIGYMPEKDAFYGEMFPLDYLIFLGTLSGLNKEFARKSAMNLINRLDLENALDTKIKNFSSGMKKKITFAQAIIHQPKIVILDEPTANLDPLAQEQLLIILKELQRTGATIFVSSHNIEELEKLIDHVIVINHGRLVLSSSLDEIRQKSSQGIEINVDNIQLARSVLTKYDLKEIDSHTLLLNASSDEKKNIMKKLIEADVKINSIASKKENLWDVVLKILKEK